jgi:hypothetical protein
LHETIISSRGERAQPRSRHQEDVLTYPTTNQVHADVQNLHLEVLRQFTLQHTEMTAMMDSLAARQDRIMAELLELKRAQQQQQVQRFN